MMDLIFLQFKSDSRKLTDLVAKLFCSTVICGLYLALVIAVRIFTAVVATDLSKTFWDHGIKIVQKQILRFDY